MQKKKIAFIFTPCLVTKIFIAMKTYLALFLLALASVSCIPGQHNSAPNVSKDPENPTVYGEIGGDPKQLKNKYEADPKVDEKATQIRDKFFK